jgi:arylsulfatase
VPAELETLAERMHAAGYRTAALGRNAMLAPRTRLDQGFDQYSFDGPLHGVPPLGTDLLERFGPARDNDLPSDRALATAGAAWVEAHRGEPFFLWLHLFDPHAPYEPPRDLLPSSDVPRRIGPSFSDMAGVRSGHLVLDARDRAWLRTLYEAEVREVDRGLGQLFARLRERGLYDDALIVLTADHGEEFWDHGAYEHGHTEYDELLHVPLIVKLPRGAGAQHDPRLASTARLAPSLLTACGVPFDAADFSGAALFTATGAAPEPESVPVMLSTGTLYFEGQSALFLGWRKYIRHEVSGREELYDLAKDPLERHDLADRDEAALAQMRERFEARVRAGAELRRRLGLGEVERNPLDADALRALRGLGYVK